MGGGLGLLPLKCNQARSGERERVSAVCVVPRVSAWHRPFSTGTDELASNAWPLGAVLVGCSDGVFGTELGGGDGVVGLREVTQPFVTSGPTGVAVRTQLKHLTRRTISGRWPAAAN